MKSPVFFPSLEKFRKLPCHFRAFSVYIQPQMWNIAAKGKNLQFFCHKPSRKTSGNGRTKLLGNCHDNRLLHRILTRMKGGERISWLFEWFLWTLVRSLISLRDRKWLAEFFSFLHPFFIPFYSPPSFWYFDGAHVRRCPNLQFLFPLHSNKHFLTQSFPSYPSFG